MNSEWLISQGTRDEAVEICRWDAAEVDRLLVGPMPLSDSLLADLAEVQKLPGWTSPQKAEYLARHVLQYRPEVAVEIGVFGGRSLLPVALAMREAEYGTVHGIDPWNNTAPLEGTQKEWDAEWWSKWPAEQVRDQFLAAVERFGLWYKINVIQAKSEDAVRKFQAGSVGLIHIDGNHSPEVSLRDVQTWWPKLRSGGWCVADDADWSSTQNAMRWLASVCVEHETRDFINEDGLGGRTRFFRKP